MAPPAPTPAALEAALAACMHPDAASRAAGEAAAAAAAKTPSHAVALATVAAVGADPAVRQLAFQQLRKAVTRHWRKLSAAGRKATTDACLGALEAEAEPTVRRQAAATAAAAAVCALPAGEWPALWEWAARAGGSPDERHREAALSVLSQVAASSPTAVAPQAVGLADAARKGLADPAPRVVAAAVDLLVSVGLGEGSGPVNPATAAAVKAASTDLFAAADRLLAGGEVDRFAEACAAAAELAECPAPVFGPAPADAASWAVAHARARAAPRTARAAPLLVLEALARGKPKQVAKAPGVVAGAVGALCELIAEPVGAPGGAPPTDGTGAGAEEASNSDEDEDGEIPVPTLAAQALDVLALHLPAKAVLPPAMAFAQAALGAADNPRARRAGCVALLVVAEGCAEPLRAALPAALAIVAAGLRDPLPSVRGQAAFALGQLAEHCQPDMASHIGSALPPVLDLLASAPRGTAAQQACYALEVMCDALDDAGLEAADVLRPHLPSLVPALVGALAGGDAETRHSALGALASAAAAAGSGFAAHAPAVLPALSHFMQAGGEPGSDEIRLRARATEAAGVVAATLGRDGAAPLLNEMVPVMVAGLAIPDSELREYTHAALANVAALVGPGVTPLLAAIVPAALASLAADDGADLGDEDEGGAGASPAGASGESLGTDDEEDDSDDDDSDDALAVRTGVLDEKVAAAHALAAYASAAGAAFAPHAGPALAALRVAARHFHDDLREAAYTALGELAKVGAAVAGGSESVPAGRPGGPPPGPAAVAATAELLPPLAAAIARDPDAGAAAAAAAAAAEAVLALGTAAAPHAAALAGAVTAVLKGEARAQAGDSDSDDDGAGGHGGHAAASDGGGSDEDDEGGEAEAHLLGCAADILPALARALGPDAYAPHWEGGHAALLAGRARADQPEDVRSAAVGAFADVALVLGAPRAAAAAAAFTPIILRELRSTSETARRNGAYAIGAAAGAAPGVVAPHAQAVLEALGGCLSAGAGADPGLRENAAGALARLALALPPGTVPLDQALPALLAMLAPAGPGFTADPGEAAPVLALCGAVCGTPPGGAGAAEPSVPAAAAALAAAAADATAPRPVRAAAARGLAAAAAARPDLGGPLVAGLAPEVRAELEALAAEAGV